MFQIYRPTTGPEDWKTLLADPEQWATGKTAKTVAERWESTKSRGFPPEVADVFRSPSTPAALRSIEPLLAIPEHQISLSGVSKATHTDVFALAKDSSGHLIAIAVEGKTADSFGPTVGEWVAMSSENANRMESMRGALGLSEIPEAIRYALVHRAASAVLEAKRFNAPTAVMLVHAIGQSDAGFSDFEDFARLFNPFIAPEGGSLARAGTARGTALYVGWAQG
jgi:hypothetical protein